ncbi:MAG TPA: PepSY domain-containing protein [Ilumatobacteraceae bacterium]|jgi:uncharacterized membrane protein YkoI
MQRKTRISVTVAAVAVVLAAAGAAARAATDDESDTPITGPALQQASTAALAATGGGRVTATEVGDEDSYYEVEVTLDDGSQVDVQLDAAFKVVSSSADDESGSDSTQD